MSTKPYLKTRDVNLVETMYRTCSPGLSRILEVYAHAATQFALHYSSKTLNQAEPLEYVTLLGF